MISPPDPIDEWDGRGLVSTAWLAAHLHDTELRIFDATAHLRAAKSRPFIVESGRADYLTAHVPGAAFLDLAGVLSDNGSPLNFTKPADARIVEAFAAAGIDAGSKVIAYSTTSPMWATRLWWMLRGAGLRSAAVLDGGFSKWQRENRPTERGARSYPAMRVASAPETTAWVDKADVLAAIGEGDTCIVDALPAAIHNGVDATNWGRVGHIATSLNVPFDKLLNDDGTFLADTKLRALFEAVGAFERDRAICYCGGGISATMAALALVRLGHPSVAVYDGSMAEWAGDPSLPMACG